MGLHVFFGCYYNLFGIMKRTGSFDDLRLKEHTHTFINSGGVSPQGLDPNALPVRC